MFENLLVIELASVLAGPSVGQFLAELGARVIKVENPDGGDVTRHWYRAGEARSRSASYFDACNFGKESAALDIRSADGRQALKSLVSRADILISSFGPGSAERLRLTSDVFQGWKPDLIHAAVTGYGQKSDRPGYDAVLQAESGFMAINGEPDGPPLKMPVALIDVMAAHHLKEGILVALLRRTATGKGACIQVSLWEAALSALANQATGWLRTGREPERTGSAHPNIAPYGTVLRSADGVEILLAVGTDRQFGGLCQVLGLTDLPTSEAFSDNACRVRNRDRLDELLQTAAAGWTGEALREGLQQRRVPAGTIRGVGNALESSGAEGVLLGATDGDDSEGPPSVGLRQWLAGARLPTLSPPPALGAHTRSVLRELTRLDDATIDRLTSQHAPHD